MTIQPKTSTFVIDHEKCDPTNWTARDLIEFESFVKFGGAARAGRLTRLGIKIVTSEHHEPLGGTLEALGYSKPLSPGDDVQLEDGPREICDAAGTDPAGVTAVVKIYQGPVQYAVGIPIGDEDGVLEGYEFEFKDTEAEAAEFARSMRETA
jgi:hypothetical protein